MLKIGDINVVVYVIYERVVALALNGYNIEIQKDGEE